MVRFFAGLQGVLLSSRPWQGIGMQWCVSRSSYACTERQGLPWHQGHLGVEVLHDVLSVNIQRFLLAVAVMVDI